MDNNSSPEVRWGDWITEGWQMFTEQWKAWVIHALVACGTYLALMGPFVAAFFILGGVFSQTSRAEEFPIFLFPITFVVSLLASLLGVFFSAGFYKSALKQVRGGRIELRDLFSGLDCLLPLLGAGILIGILQMIGFVMCIIPALIVAGLMFFAVPLIADGRLGVIDAMKASYEKTKGNWIMFTLFAIVVSLIASAGSYACYIGLLATYPLHFTIGVIAYRDCFGIPGARNFLPQATQQPGAAYSISPGAPERVPASENLNCQQCGASMPQTALFCPRCGNRTAGYSS